LSYVPVTETQNYTLAFFSVKRLKGIGPTWCERLGCGWKIFYEKGLE